jgi:hypothetical protein
VARVRVADLSGELSADPSGHVTRPRRSVIDRLWAEPRHLLHITCRQLRRSASLLSITLPLATACATISSSFVGEMTYGRATDSHCGASRSAPKAAGQAYQREPFER